MIFWTIVCLISASLGIGWVILGRTPQELAEKQFAKSTLVFYTTFGVIIGLVYGFLDHHNNVLFSGIMGSAIGLIGHSLFSFIEVCAAHATQKVLASRK